VKVSIACSSDEKWQDDALAFSAKGISCHDHRVLRSVAPERSANVADLESGALDQSPIPKLRGFH
jgi:hypothetical protein